MSVRIGPYCCKLKFSQRSFWSWPSSTPRGMIREVLAGQNSLTWSSKYRSVITSAYNISSTDGMNEKSLAGHMLWIAESDYGKRDENIPGLSQPLAAVIS